MRQGFLSGLWSRIAGQKTSTSPTPNYQLKIISRDNHTISRKNISQPALKVLYKLNDAGHPAYLVGGSVRDLLLGQKPKDFDVATAAIPEEVHRHFRNSRLIGRRFKLVHVLFGREVIEVATFRGHHKGEDDLSEHQSASSEHGMLLRDNVYGTMEEDALRRDFTVNALYYCIKDFAIYDYADGLKDLKARQIRLIGDPQTRYREDPVRMLRAIRFAAKLDFCISKETEVPIAELAPLLSHIPPARLFEEVLKLFLAGSALKTFELLRQYNLFEQLFPVTEASLKNNDTVALKLIREALRNTDSRIQQEKPVTPAFLYAAMLWPAFNQLWHELMQSGLPAFPALQQAAHEVIHHQGNATAIPKRFSLPMKDIWELQLRLPKRQGRRAEQLLEHPKFRAGYDFLLLRESSGEKTDGLGAWWTNYLNANDQQRTHLSSDVETTPKARKPRRRKKPGGAGRKPATH
ncbi:MAG: polynucleotide adenylyltransferase PcnB [Hahellaceae bacterium]|nr:polynucleotide adenylyltransferase PcnB [Hahellaceae bacterium]MCP5168495.1 polynucleotide adenylyltransferase PcnB [Hahellaceae bacterium]